MFSSTIARINAKREELAVQADHLEASALAATGNFSSLLVDDLNEEVRQVYETQQLLERESQLLTGELASLTQQLTSWSTTTQQLLEALKHVGDLEHYVAVLTREAEALAKVLSSSADTTASAAVAQALQEAVHSAGAALSSGAAQASSCSNGANVTSPKPPLRQLQQQSIAQQDILGAGGATSSAALHSAATQQQQQQQDDSLAPELPVSKRASR